GGGPRTRVEPRELPIRPALARQHVGLDQGAHALLEEKRVASRPIDQQSTESLQARIVAEQRVQKLSRALVGQRVEPQLVVVGLVAQSVPILWPIVDEEENVGRREALDQTVEKGLRLRVDPGEVLEDDQQRPDLTLPQ